MRTCAPSVCFVGIAPTVGDAAIGQSILQQLKARLDLPLRVHATRRDIFAALPEVGESDEVLPKLPIVPAPALRSPLLPARVAALVGDVRRTGGARRLPAPVYAGWRAALEGCAAVVFQGGPDWNDRMLNRRKAFERWLLLEAARHYGTPAFHVGVSCGPFAWRYPERLWMAALCRGALDRYEILFVRDRFSRPALNRLGVKARVIESTDAAVFLTSCPDRAYAHVEDRIRASSSRPRLVACLRDFQPRYESAVRERDEVLRNLARVLDHVQANLADVFFLSTDYSDHPEKDSDVAVARAVARMMTRGGWQIIEEEVRTPSALKHLYSLFDGMISMRLHPTVLALDRGVPCLLLSYDDKCDDFFARLGLSDYAVPLSGFRAETAIPQVAGMLNDQALRARIAASYRGLRAAHARDYEPMFERIERRLRAAAHAPADTRRATA